MCKDLHPDGCIRAIGEQLCYLNTESYFGNQHSHIFKIFRKYTWSLTVRIGVLQCKTVKANTAHVAHVLVIYPEEVARLIGSSIGACCLPRLLAIVWGSACVAGQRVR